jgi:hypothetical protein
VVSALLPRISEDNHLILFKREANVPTSMRLSRVESLIPQKNRRWRKPSESRRICLASQPCFEIKRLA